MSTNPVIDLDKPHYLSEGKFRWIYVHPENPDLCIKVGKEIFHNRALSRELKYTKKHQNRLPFLSKLHGSIDTSLGTGYIYDLVRDFNGEVSNTLENVVDSLDENELKRKLIKMYECLLESRSPVCDFHARNILIKRISSDDYELWIVDGFGNSDFIKICDYSKFFLKKKLIRKFNSLCHRLKIASIFETQ